MRDVRLDRLRALAVFGIVLIHAFYRTGYFEILPESSAQYFGGMTAYTLAFPMTNVFVIISSYFLIDRGGNWARARDLMIRTTAFSLVIYLLILALGVADFSPMELLACVLSAPLNQYWFISAYIILYLLSPYLNKMLAALTQQELKRLCLILAVVLCVLPTVLVFVPVQSLFDGKNGKGILWFGFLYAATYYLKKYGDSILNIHKKLLYLTVVGSVLMLIASNVVLKKISLLLGMGGDGAARLYFDSSLPVALISFVVVILALQQKVPAAGRGWTYLAQASLIVYLVHEQPALKNALWAGVRTLLERWPGQAFWIVLAVSVAVYALCLVVDALYRKLFSCK